jgi:hypothetical protein
LAVVAQVDPEVLQVALVAVVQADLVAQVVVAAAVAEDSIVIATRRAAVKAACA